MIEILKKKQSRILEICLNSEYSILDFFVK